MAPTPNPFWQEVRAQALAGILVAVSVGVCGGIGYLIHRVPRQLDQVLENQQTFRTEMDSVQREVRDQGNRLIRLEATR